MHTSGDNGGEWYPEDTLFEGESLVAPIRFGVFSRVAVTFAFLSWGKLVPIDSQTIRNNFHDLELVAAVGNNRGPWGMFAQAAWFGEGGAPWVWMRITNINNIILYHTKMEFSFRSGTQPCVGAHTDRGVYFLTVPHPDYRELWQSSLKTLWPATKVDVQVWPLEGHRPIWWHESYKDDWPFDRSEDEEISKEDTAPKHTVTKAPPKL